MAGVLTETDNLTKMFKVQGEIITQPGGVYTSELHLANLQ